MSNELLLLFKCEEPTSLGHVPTQTYIMCQKGVYQVSSIKLKCNPYHTFISPIKFIDMLQTITVLNTKVYKPTLLPYRVTFLNGKNPQYTKHHTLPHLVCLRRASMNKLSQGQWLLQVMRTSLTMVSTLQSLTLVQSERERDNVVA